MQNPRALSVEIDQPGEALSLARPEASRRTWTQLRWVGKEKRFEARFAGLFFFSSRTISLPFSALRSASLAADLPARGLLPLSLTLRYQSQDGEAEIEIPFWVKALDLRAEALDLAFRIAQVLRWPWYALAQDTPERLVIDLIPEQKVQGEAHPFRLSSGRLHPVPALPEAADYQALSRVEQPPVTEKKEESPSEETPKEGLFQRLLKRLPRKPAPAIERDAPPRPASKAKRRPIALQHLPYNLSHFISPIYLEVDPTIPVDEIPEWKMPAESQPAHVPMRVRRRSKRANHKRPKR